MAEAAPTIPVSVVYAEPSGVWQVACEVAEGTTIEAVIRQSGFADQFAGVNLAQHGVGIFGIQRPLSFTVRAGDRIEIYRALDFDPMESRRRRAAHKAKQPRGNRPRVRRKPNKTAVAAL